MLLGFQRREQAPARRPIDDDFRDAEGWLKPARGLADARTPSVDAAGFVAPEPSESAVP